MTPEDFDSLRAKGRWERRPECPSEDEWARVAAGLIRGEEAERLTEHAARCEYCGGVLRTMVEDFEEESTEEEEKTLAGFGSAERGWHRAVARRMSEAGRRGKRNWWVGLGMVAMVALAVGGVWTWRKADGGKGRTEALLARAYTEKRVLEMRTPGAGYGPLRVTRGRAEGERPAELLEAEAEIARERERSPEDGDWAELKARADVVEGGRSEEAIAALERLAEEKPDDAATLLDLACAYSERAQAMNRPVDYGRALDLAGRVLEREPRNAVALFNRAVALERLAMYGQAEAAWKKYLEIDGKGGWAEEARGRLKAVEEVLKRRKERTEKRLETPGEFARDAAKASEEKAAELDGRVERYLEAARQEWLPRAFPADGGAGNTEAREGLEALARWMRERHGDRWLGELMAAGRGDARFGQEVGLLARGYAASMAGDDDGGMKDAEEALAGFQRARNEAGAMEAGWQRLYAVRLGLKDRDCLAMGEAQWRVVEKSGYEWLRGRTLLDYAECASAAGRKGLGARLAAEDAGLSGEKEFGDLYLRAVTVLASDRGDTTRGVAAYALNVEGLRKFWDGDYGYMAGYNLFVGLDDSAEAMGLWRLDAEAIEEALALTEDDPDRWMRAAEEERLASALEHCGRLSEAGEVLKRTEEQLRPGAAGEAMENRLADIETGIAGIELERGESGRALARLEAVGGKVKRMASTYVELPYFTVYGEALEARGRRARAGEAYAEAITVSEAALRSFRAEGERVEWSRRSERAYRDMVALKLRDDPAEALEWWERFRCASLGRGGRTAALGEAPPEAVLIYIEGRDGVGVWGRAGSGWRYRRLMGGGAEGMGRIRRFTERCAEPGTNAEWLRREGEWIYGELVAPVEGWLRGHGRLIVETDGSLDGLPFEALVDRGRKYLGETYRVSYSPGLAYLAAGAGERGYSAASRALVVGDAAAHPQFELPALPGAETEAREVAGYFRGAKLLLSGAATEEAIAREMPRAEIFHFAGHAISNASRAGLVVEGEGGDELYAAEEMERSGPGSTRLAVLSACASARGTGGGFSDSESVARRMVAAGVGQVVASRWPVDSAAAEGAMKLFYAALSRGETAGEAWSEAQRRMRAGREWSHPYYWAAFAMFGGS